MNRRQMVALPGVALVASRGIAGNVKAPGPSVVRLTPRKVQKMSRAKSVYSIPKTQKKQAKYVNFLATLLALTPDQQQQAVTIFSAALDSQAALRNNLKAARQRLSVAVKNNDSASITEASSMIGNVAAQRHSIGASANAAFYQTLTSYQQSKLPWFQS